jgi:hypothetical protein
MDGSDFDALTHTLAAYFSRRVTRGGLLVALGLALEEAVALAKKGKGKGHKGRGGKKGKNKKKKDKCTSAKDSCTFSLHPCCGDTICCDPTGSGFSTCLPPVECCLGNTCSSAAGTECAVGCTCQNRDMLGFGKCLLA